MITVYLLFLSGCATHKSIKISTSNNTVPKQVKYNIRTRIIVEELSNSPARNTTDIIKDIWYVQEVYASLGIKLIIVEMGIGIPNQDWEDYIAQDANNHPESMSIYYTFGRVQLIGFPPIDGIGSLPWMDIPYGVMVYGPTSPRETLAHEIGHYLGLYHTFYEDPDGNGDFVDDTLSREEYVELKGEDDSYCNYNNIMNYHWHGTNSFATQGQIDRMESYLRNDRSSHLMHNLGVESISAPILFR